MAYIALYRKWRPSVFEDVVEQEHVVKTLRQSVNTGRIAHAYLFCGTRGTGKTTMAKILSRAINCLNPKGGDPCNECEICKGILSGNILDVVEIDAASNNSVDNVREIRDEVIYAPSQAKYKVYIIDEVHMLSTGAFNALLKTLEEPPQHVVFILATTEPHKLPATILSRCQRFDFRRISIESIIGRLEDICKANNVSVQKEGLRLIARMSDGALRDAISILDQCISLGKAEISYSDVLSVIGIVNDSFMGEMIDSIGRKDINGILKLIEQLIMDGKDISQFVSDLVLYYRNLLICKMSNKPEEIIDVSEESLEKMKGQSGCFSQEEIMYIIKELSSLEAGLKWAAHPRILLEVSLIKLCKFSENIVSDDLAERLSALERKLENGEFKIKTSPESGAIPPAAPIPRAEKESRTAKLSEPSNQKEAKGFVDNRKSIEKWEDVLNELRKSGRMVLYTNLLNTKAVEIDDKFVGIVFGEGSSFGRMLVSKAENLEVVEEVVGRMLNRAVKIKCLDGAELASSQGSKEAEKDEFIEKAQDIAKRLNTPLNIIDE